MASTRRQASSTDAQIDLADRLHSAAIHLLRRLRMVDELTGLSPARLSALSVVVFAGPISIGALAAAEQVRPPTISRLVKELERDGLVSRRTDPTDERVQLVSSTAKGRRLLRLGRRRRVAQLAADLGRLAPEERRLLTRAARVLARLTGSDTAR